MRAHKRQKRKKEKKEKKAVRGQVVAGKNDKQVRRQKRKGRTRLQEEEQKLMAARGGSGR